ncbi:hypothetical protein [Actinophytocola sp.]|jgi:uncharacterized membrane protein YkoI|uniref:PepSY domain-containing protein n=1 Tax=Actinophytocola sp. TaxID=1872138 RepID=UPI002ED8C1FD
MKRRTVWIFAGAIAVAVTGGGAGVAIAAGQGDDDGTERPITGDALTKATTAALEHTGSGRVTGTEIGDEKGYYEVEVTQPDGSQRDVHLDQNFAVLGSTGDSRGDSGDK